MKSKKKSVKKVDMKSLNPKNIIKKVPVPVVVTRQATSFLSFIREQGVVGLAVGFILGASVSKVVSSIVNDLINPFLGLLLGSKEGLAQAYFEVSGAKVTYGNFLSVLVDFVVIALVVYLMVRVLKLDRLDKKKG